MSVRNTCMLFSDIAVTGSIRCLHIDTSPDTRVRVPVIHEFACIPMAAVHIDASSVRVRVTCEFHSYEQFLEGRVFIQPVRCKQRKICINLFIHAMMHILRHKLLHF